MESPRPPTNTQPCALPSRTCAQRYTPLFESYPLRLYRTDLKHWKSNDLSIFRKMYMISERTTGPDRGLLYPSGSWITDISIKPIIQIVVSHGPLKSHSANAPLARFIVWIMQAHAVSMWSLHVTSWKVQVLVDVLSFFSFLRCINK